MPIARRSRRDAPWVPWTSAPRTGSVSPDDSQARAAAIRGDKAGQGMVPSYTPSTRPAPAGGTLAKRQTSASQGQTTDMSSPPPQTTSDADTGPATTTGDSSTRDTRTAADTTSQATATTDASTSEPSTSETGSDSDALTSLFPSTEMLTSSSTPRPTTSDTSESTRDPSTSTSEQSFTTSEPSSTTSEEASTTSDPSSTSDDTSSAPPESTSTSSETTTESSSNVPTSESSASSSRPTSSDPPGSSSPASTSSSAHSESTSGSPTSSREPSTTSSSAPSTSGSSTSSGSQTSSSQVPSSSTQSSSPPTSSAQSTSATSSGPLSSSSAYTSSSPSSFTSSSPTSSATTSSMPASSSSSLSTSYSESLSTSLSSTSQSISYTSSTGTPSSTSSSYSPSHSWTSWSRTSSREPPTTSTSHTRSTSSSSWSSTSTWTSTYVTTHLYTSTEVVGGGTHTVAHTSVSTITQTGVLGTNPAEDSHGFDKNTGAIVGVAIAAVAGVVAAALLLFIGCRRYRRKRESQSASSSRVGLAGIASPQGSVYRRAPLEEDDDAPPMTELAAGALPLPFHASSSGHSDFRDEVDLASYNHGSSSGHGSAEERRPSLSATSHMPAFGQAAEAMGANEAAQMPGTGRVSFDPGVWIGGKEGSAPLGSPSTEQSSSQGHGSHVLLLPYHSSSGSSQGHGSHSSSHSLGPTRPILKQPTPPSSYIMHSGSKADWRQSLRAEVGDTHAHRDSADARSFRGFLGRLRGGLNSSAPEMRDAPEGGPEALAHPAVRIPSSLLDPAPVAPGSVSKGKRWSKAKAPTPPIIVEPVSLLSPEEEAAARAANNGMPWPPATLPPTPGTALDAPGAARAEDDAHEREPGVTPHGELDVIAFDDEEHQHPWAADPHPSPAASEDSRHGEHLLNPMLRLGMRMDTAAEESMTSLRDHLDYSRPIGHLANLRTYSSHTFASTTTMTSQDGRSRHEDADR